MSIPATWPPVATGGAYKVIIIDEGSYRQDDVTYGLKTEAVMCVRVENLPDTEDAIQDAVDAARAAYPTYPSDTCMVLDSIGPMFGHTRLLGNSMVVGRMMTTDSGHACKTVILPSTVGAGTTGSTGCVVLLKMLYKYPQTFSAL